MSDFQKEVPCVIFHRTDINQHNCNQTVLTRYCHISQRAVSMSSCVQRFLCDMGQVQNKPNDTQ